MTRIWSCPLCGEIGRPVADATIRSMLGPELSRGLLATERRFCKTPGCDVVYYAAAGPVVRKQEVRVRIGLKEKEDPIPLCYCFGFDRADVEREVAQTGHCTIPERIAADIVAGRCACQIRNPSGACCLGEVRAAAGEALRRAGSLPKRPA
jgi:CopZ-like zinc binding protein